MTSQDFSPPPRGRTGIDIPRPVLFWVGVAMTSAGVVLHLPAFFQMRSTGYRMSMDTGHGTQMNMGTSPAMLVGMALLCIGVFVAVGGLLQRRPTPEAAAAAGRYRVQAGAQDKLSRAHVKLIVALSLAMIIDIMKPATLAFILPGMRAEYHISVAQSSSLPVVALTGTVLGSLMWGYLGDRIGRRATILLSSVIFIATTVCSMMPTFTWNLVMCFMMGMAAGGLLPVAYAMMAESVPARQRSFLMVLQAGLATTAAYFFTSGLATLLLPAFGWRIMWFTHFPFAVLILLLNRWIPESPRFLIQHGRITEARQVVATYGMELVDPAEEPKAPKALSTAQQHGVSGREALRALFGRHGIGRSVIVGLYALSWGGINWGFMTFLPALLKSGSSIGTSANSLLFFSSFLAIPGTALVAFCYARWSSRKTMALYGLLTVVALGFLALVGLGGTKMLTLAMLGLLITGTSGVIAMLAPYTAEVYPTRVRSVGSGFAAACSKAGGMFGPPALALILTSFPGVRVIALVCAVPMAVATLAVGLRGTETAGRDLEEVEQPQDLSAPEPVGAGHVG